METNLKQLICNIRNMSMEEFCARVNELARATRYCTADDNVCELLDTTKTNIKVAHLDPDYFESETAYIVIDEALDNECKELFIKCVLSGWEACKDDYISNLAD